MKAAFLTRLFLSRWHLHTPCAILCVLACLPALWPRLPLAEEGSPLANYAGMLLFGTFCLSSCMMVFMVVHLLLRLRNKKAVLYLLAWAGQWSLAALVFMFMAIVADVPPLPVVEASHPIQETDTLHPANEELTGPSALVIPIHPEDSPATEVAETPNLKLLEEEHEQVLTSFLEASPRWAARADDTFYSRPGHVVMVPPTTGGTPGLVHVCFRRLIEGEPLPQGYRVVKSGDAFPKAPAGQEQVPDLALDLGRNHYLLLAWRGTSHAATAHKALNAAITAVDSRMQELADSPTVETAEALNKGKLNMTGNSPELRLCEPPAQFGAYQAEIYANPHEPGTLLVYIRELETNRTLRILNCPALYSDNENELFRHDLPGSVPQWMRDGGFSSSRHLFEPDTPLFAIREGEPHRYFGVAFEVRFKPIDPRQPSRLILRRCYKVEAYEKPAPSEALPPAAKRAPDELTPAIALPAPQATPPAALPSPEAEEKAQREKPRQKRNQQTTSKPQKPLSPDLYPKSSPLKKSPLLPPKSSSSPLKKHPQQKRLPKKGRRQKTMRKALRTLSLSLAPQAPRRHSPCPLPALPQCQAGHLQRPRSPEAAHPCAGRRAGKCPEQVCHAGHPAVSP